MKKTLNISAIQNELKGQSLFFQSSKKSQANSKSVTKAKKDQLKRPQNVRTPERVNERTVERTNARTHEQVNARTSERTNGRTDERDTKNRKTVRYSFQFYLDQIDQIKRLRAQKELEGNKCDLSQLAREAFDMYLSRTDERVNG